MITDPLQDQGSACLGGRKKVTAQNVIAQDKKPKFQSVDRMQAPVGGRQALPGGAAGCDMIVGFAHYAEVFYRV